MHHWSRCPIYSIIKKCSFCNYQMYDQNILKIHDLLYIAVLESREAMNGVDRPYRLHVKI